MATIDFLPIRMVTGGRGGVVVTTCEEGIGGKWREVEGSGSVCNFDQEVGVLW